MSSRSKKSGRVPSPRCGPSRNGTRPTSTVIWPAARRRAEHVLLNLKAQGIEPVPSMTDFMSAAADVASKAAAAKHGVSFPAAFDFSVTK